MVCDLMTLEPLNAQIVDSKLYIFQVEFQFMGISGMGSSFLYSNMYLDDIVNQMKLKKILE
jgi:hypothetical protein